VEPTHVSDHLCWTGLGGHNSHDLLPLPFTAAAVARFGPQPTLIERDANVPELPVLLAEARQAERIQKEVGRCGYWSRLTR
jgi:uncharacterized protein (UPF0276 family)